MNFKTIALIAFAAVASVSAQNNVDLLVGDNTRELSWVIET